MKKKLNGKYYWNEEKLWWEKKNLNVNKPFNKTCVFMCSYFLSSAF